MSLSSILVSKTTGQESPHPCFSFACFIFSASNVLFPGLYLPLQGSTSAVSTSQASALCSKCWSLVAQPSPRWVAFIQSIPLRICVEEDAAVSARVDGWSQGKTVSSWHSRTDAHVNSQRLGQHAQCGQACTGSSQMGPSEKEEDTQSHPLTKKLFAMDICWQKRKESVFANGVSINHTPGQVPSNIKWTPCFIWPGRGGAFVSFCFVWELVVLLFVHMLFCFCFYLLREGGMELRGCRGGKGLRGVGEGKWSKYITWKYF